MQNKGIKIEFSIADNDFNISTKEKGFEIVKENNKVSFSIFYDYSEKPLVINAPVKANDNVEINIMHLSIEIVVNGEVQDEEWPCGNCFYKLGDKIDSNTWFKVSEFEILPQKEQPCVLGEFIGGEGWKPGERVYVGDCIPYYSKGRYHVIYLRDRHHHTAKWGNGAHIWEHISTTDFKQWRAHPTAIKLEDPIEGAICTGCWIEKDGIEYLYFTIRRVDGSPAPLMRCVSTDGYHFERDKNFRFYISDKYNKAIARDPKIILAEDGLYHMLLTTSYVADGRGCLIHFISNDLENWTEEDKPEYVVSDEDIYCQPECSDYVKYNGYYYLAFSIRGEGEYLYSDKPFGAWKTPVNPKIPCGVVPKLAEWQGKIVFTGFKRYYEGKYGGTLTFKTADVNEKHELVFEK